MSYLRASLIIVTNRSPFLIAQRSGSARTSTCASGTTMLISRIEKSLHAIYCPTSRRPLLTPESHFVASLSHLKGLPNSSLAPFKPLPPTLTPVPGVPTLDPPLSFRRGVPGALSTPAAAFPNLSAGTLKSHALPLSQISSIMFSRIPASTNSRYFLHSLRAVAASSIELWSTLR